MVLLGDFPVLVVPHHHRHRRADDITHHLGCLAVPELLRRADVPEGEPLCGGGVGVWGNEQETFVVVVVAG